MRKNETDDNVGDKDEHPVRVLDFDLAALTWAGWLLLLASVGFVAGLIWFGAPYLAPVVERLRLNEWGKALFGIFILFAGAGFFYAGMLLLGRLGLSVWRKDKHGPPS